MIVKLEHRVAYIERTDYLMNILSLDIFDALRMAEKEYIEQMKNEGEENE